jgi:hypothetical protein
VARRTADRQGIPGMYSKANDEHTAWCHTPSMASLAFARSVVAGVQKRGTGLLVASLMGLVAITKFGDTIHHDVAWYIHSAAAFLDGGQLYDDVFFEMNPPLMLYLTVPGVMLARSTGLFSVNGYLLTVFAAIGLSLWFGMRMIPAPRRSVWLILSFFALVVLPAGDFGQRPHVMVALGLPYLLLVARRWHDPGRDVAKLFAIAVGASAGLGFAVKPHFLLVPAILELTLWYRTRRLTFVRPEMLALCAVVALYIASIVVFTPTYLTRIVPYALEVYQIGYRNPLVLVLARPETILLLVLVYLYWRRRRALAPDLAAEGDIFSISAIVLFAVYVMQMKGWNYHLYPTTAMLMMLAGVLLTDSPAVSRPLRTMVFAFTIALVSKAAVLSDTNGSLMDRLLPAVRAHAPHSIHVFSANVSSGFPMTVYADVRWASRFPALWLIPGIEQRRRATSPDADPDRLAEIERFATEAVIADLSEGRPELVFVDVRPWKPWQSAIDLDFIDRFSADARFAALWARYELIGEEQGFEIYRRRPDPAGSGNGAREVGPTG